MAMLRGKVRIGLSLRAVQQRNWSKLATKAEVRLALDQLETLGWSRLSVIETKGRSSTIIMLNPALELNM
jgi:hypothetical protein